MSTSLRGWPAKAVLGCVLGLALPVLSASAAEAQNRPTACDILTAHPDDPNRVSEPVPWNERDTGRAIPACEEAVRREPNDMRLRFQLGLAQDSAGNHAASIGHYTAAAQGGYVAAGMAVAWALANGEGTARDDVKAAQWYRWAADRGHSGAANTLGFMFEHGRGVPRDLGQAAEWYRRAYAMNGRPVAGFNHARLIAAGRDVPRDLPRAVQLLRAVTQTGRTDAALHLALMAERNEAPGVSPNEMIQLLAFAETAAAQQGRARRSLSRLAPQGLGAEVEQAQRAAATRVAAQERQDDERRRARERAYAAAVGASGGMVGSLAPLSAPSASADGATPDTGGGLPANSLVRASITAPDNPTPGATFRIEWRMAANMPDRPHLLRGQALSAAPTGGSQPATFDLNERLSRRARQDLLVISLPESVRVEGSGFAVVPPRANMPFGAQYEMDRLKIVIPLHFSESPISGVLNVRFFSSGESHINIERIMVANDGRVLHTEQAEQFTIEIIDKNPDIIVQDIISATQPNTRQLSPQNFSGEREFELRVFANYFEVIQRSSGGLLARIDGSDPFLSPNGRFVAYYSGIGFALYDVLARAEVFRRNTHPHAGELPFAAFAARSEFFFIPETQANGMQEGGGSFWAFSPYRDDINPRHDLIKEARRHVQRTCTGSTAPSNPICDTGPPTALSLLYDIDRFLIGSLRTSSAVQDFSIRSIVDRTAVAAPTMIDLVGAFRNSTAPINPINTNIQELRFPIQAEDGLKLEGGLRAPPPPIGGRPYFERITQALIDTVEFNDTTAGDLSNGLNPANSQYRGIQIVQNTSESFIDNRRLQSFLEDIGISFDTGQARVAIASYGGDSGDSTDSINRLINSQNRSMLNTIRRVLQHFAPITRDARNNEEFYMNDIAIWSWQFDGGDAIVLRIGGDTFDKPLWCLIPSNLIVQNQDVRRFCRQDIPRDSRDSSVEAGEGAAVYPFSVTGDGRRFAIGISGYQQIWLFDTRSGITSAQPISVESFGFLGYYCAERGRPETCTNTATRAVFDFVNDGKILLQRNRDGRFYIYNLEQRQRIINGLILDDEFIVYDSYGFYDASAEGAHYVYRFFPGLREHHSFAQFSRFFHRPDIVRSIVADRPFNRPRMELLAPPSIDFSARVFQSNARKIQLSFDIRASVPLRTVRLFRDGLPFAEIPLTGRASRLSREFELPDGRHNLTAVAYDERGFSSNSRSVPVQIGPDPRGTGQLRYVGIAVNEYPRMVADQNLRFAVRDAGLLRNTLLGLQGQRRGQIQATVLADADATGESILSSLRRSAEQTGPDDVLVVSFAGHGAREGERFFFLPHQGSFADPAGSGVEWSAIAAALAPAQGRVLVLLDACHSGAARGDALIPNDAYAEQLMSSGRAGLAVLAAAKGRQFSFEDASLEGGHGFFSYMIARALGTDRATADRDRSGTIELDELYAFVRRNVSERTRDAPGGQTPWLAREEFIGRVSLF